MTSDSEVKTIKGIGPKLSEHLSRLGINTKEDLLFHLPTRYQDRTRITPINNARDGHYVIIEGHIQRSHIQLGKRRYLLCYLADATGLLTLRFFNFNQYQQKQLAPGKTLRCFGEIRRIGQHFEMAHPEYQFITENNSPPLEKTLTPIYPTTEGISQKTLRKLTDIALETLQVTELLPEVILNQFNLAPLEQALLSLHRPSPEILMTHIQEGKHPHLRRLIFEELVAHQLSVLEQRKKQHHYNAPVFSKTSALIATFIEQLPFSLTRAQQRVSQEIVHDLNQPNPMLRLVQGDVGSGKTVVAALAILQAIANHHQAALMAPTEILAEQHFYQFQKWLTPLNLKVGWLSGSLSLKQKKEVIENLQLGLIDVVIGTHALIEENVQFKQLGLVVIDEQHRFGVAQRLNLVRKCYQDHALAHQLIMTATPIPRTLAMTAYADVDVSIIDELPPGRTPVHTIALPQERRQEVIERIALRCQSGQQVYWVCCLIEASEALNCQAAEKTYLWLSEQLPSLNIGLVHGRMKPREKEIVMAEFKARNIHLLVATTVIEVGVDVPNASLMVIENPERLGLSQLHQLRGRVGRGHQASHCILLYQSPLSLNAKERLSIMRQTHDGFVIAEKDLELRGPGELLGTKQSGVARLKIADIVRDAGLIPEVQQASRLILKEYPERVNTLVTRWLPKEEAYIQA